MLTFDPMTIFFVIVAGYVVGKAASMEERPSWLWGGLAAALVLLVPYPFSALLRTILVVIILFGIMTAVKMIARAVKKEE